MTTDEPFRTDVIRDLAALPENRRLEEQVDEALIACADRIEALGAEVARKDEALIWIAENYENGHLNHVDFRVGAKHRAGAALKEPTK